MQNPRKFRAARGSIHVPTQVFYGIYFTAGERFLSRPKFFRDDFGGVFARRTIFLPIKKKSRAGGKQKINTGRTGPGFADFSERVTVVGYVCCE